MIRIVVSNRTERLLEALAEDLAHFRARSGPLAPAHVLVPNQAVETFVQVELARRTGIAANLRFHRLERFVAELAERALPEAPLLDQRQIEGRLLAVFHDDEALADPELAPLRAYLYAEAGRADDLDLRRVQLAARLAHLFDEYAHGRPELLAAWRAGRTTDVGPPWTETEAWQRRLWLRVLAGGGAVLPDLGDVPAASFLHAPTPLHVFGFSYVARAFHDVFARLAEAGDVLVYGLVPCGEGQGAVDADDGLAALRAWCRPAGEHLRLLTERTGAVLERRFEDPGDSTLLSRVQRALLAGTGTLAAIPDGSVRVLECPGVRREVEIVAAEIWRLVREDDERGGSLRFNDVAVILPAARREAYQAQVAAVFEEMHQLPHCVVDLPLASESRVVEAALLLLDLPLTGLTRPQVLRVLLHPAIRARFPDADPDDWLRLCDDLAIVHGADRADHAGTYIEGDLYNWDQGVRRLALGACLAGRRSGIERPFELGGERYLPEEVAPGDLEGAASFALLVRSLVADARFARGARLSVAGWARWLRALLRSYVTVASGADERALDRCLGAIAGLEDMGLGETPVSYRVAAALCRAALSSLETARGQYLGEGVVVSTVSPMRAVPFRVVFLLGLDEGAFPAAPRRDRLDLRQAARLAGDVDPRERDRYLFLELLACARERLYLSYVARDDVTGDRLQPSSVVVDLLRIFEDPKALSSAFALRRDEDPHTSAFSPAAAWEAWARAAGEDLRRLLGAPHSRLDLDALPGATRRALSEPLGLCRPPDVARPARDRIVLSLAALRQFLECPLQGGARIALGMRDDDEEDLAARDTETFATSPLDRAVMLREAFLAAWKRDPGLQGRALEEEHDALRAIYELRGAAPTGPFGAAERARHLGILRAWGEQLRRLAPEGVHLTSRAFGRAPEHAPVETIEEPLVLEVPAPDGTVTRVELHGRTEAILESPRGSVLLLATSNADRTREWRASLRAILDHAVLTASGALPEGAHEAFILRGAEGAEPRRIPLRSWGAEEARDYLTRLAAAALSRTHDYLLPCEAVFEHLRQPTRDVTEIVLALREDPFHRCSFHFGPVRHPERYAPPSEEEARSMIAERFAPLRVP